MAGRVRHSSRDSGDFCTDCASSRITRHFKLASSKYDRDCEDGQGRGSMELERSDTSAKGTQLQLSRAVAAA